MMDAEEITDLWVKDGVMNSTPDEEAYKTSRHHAKYIKFMAQAKDHLYKAKIIKDKMYSEKWHVYTAGYANVNQEKELEALWLTKPDFRRKYIKTDLPSVLDADRDIIQTRSDVARLEAVVDILTDIMKNINNRGFAIQAYIGWKNYEAGK